MKVTADDGTVGWGETYGIVAPHAVTAIIDDVLAPVDRRPRSARRRGDPGGPLRPDARARLRRRLLRRRDRRRRHRAVGPVRQARRPAAREAAGRPARATACRPTCRACRGATLAERVALAREWVAKGFDAIKYAAAVSHEGIVAEMRALREALGPDVEADGRPALEVHRRRGDPADRRAGAVPSVLRRGAVRARGHRRARRRSPRQSRVPIAAGEEWRTVYEVLPRFERRAVSVAAARDGPHRRHAVPRDRPPGRGVPGAA